MIEKVDHVLMDEGKAAKQVAAAVAAGRTAMGETEVKGVYF